MPSMPFVRIQPSIDCRVVLESKGKLQEVYHFADSPPTVLDLGYILARNRDALPEEPADRWVFLPWKEFHALVLDIWREAPMLAHWDVSLGATILSFPVGALILTPHADIPAGTMLFALKPVVSQTSPPSDFALLQWDLPEKPV